MGACRGGGRSEENESSLGANSEEGNGARGGSTGTDAGSDGAAKVRCEQQQVGRSSQQRDGGDGINIGDEETAARG